MASGKSKAPKQKIRNGSKSLKRNPRTPIFKKPNRIPLGEKLAKTKKEKGKTGAEPASKSRPLLLSNASASQQLRFFLDRFQSANEIRLSSLELEGFEDTCMVELSKGLNQDDSNLSEHLKATFGTSWKEVLWESQLLKGKIFAGSPAVLIIGASALRSLELLRENNDMTPSKFSTELVFFHASFPMGEGQTRIFFPWINERGVRSLTRQCSPAKLFAKHIKVEDQVSLLKSRVNIACGTPSRIKKLIDMDALGLSRLALVLLDMHTDVKGYSLFTLPQISGDFWDLYKSHFHQRLLEGDLRFCLYGTISGVELKNAVPSDE